MRTIPEKESLTIEFKSDRSGYSDADLVDEIVGMANTQGGDLYLGVEDDGEITGVGKKRQDPVGAAFHALTGRMVSILHNRWKNIKKTFKTRRNT